RLPGRNTLAHLGRFVRTRQSTPQFFEHDSISRDEDQPSAVGGKVGAFRGREEFGMFTLEGSEIPLTGEMSIRVQVSLIFANLYFFAAASFQRAGIFLRSAS